MAATRETTVERIKMLEGGVAHQYTAGATVVAGELVAMQSDGKVDPAIATAVCNLLGVALNSAEDGDALEVCILGRVLCLTGATVGALIYVSDTAGEPGESAGTKTTIAGIAESATILLLRPSTVSLS
jgi:hypothetical protein